MRLTMIWRSCDVSVLRGGLCVMGSRLTKEERYMREAVKQAKKAYALGEVPIGCIIVYENKIIGRGYNRSNSVNNKVAHAEFTAIR